MAKVESSRDCLETPTHGLTASPSAASSPRRQRTLRSRTTSRSPWPSSGCGRSTRRCAPPPTSSARPENPRRHEPLPVHLLALLSPLFRPDLGYLLGDRLCWRLAYNLDAHAQETSSAHLLPLPR